MKVLVTGGAGFIGSHVVDAMLADGHTVLTVDDYSMGVRYRKVPEWDGVGKIYCNLREMPANAIIGIDAVVHCAARADISANWSADWRSEQDRMWRENLGATTALLRVLPASCRQVVFLSTCAMYNDSSDAKETDIPWITSPYAASKLACEAEIAQWCHYQGCRGRRMASTTLRLAVVLGARLHHGHAADFVRMARETGVITAKSSGSHKKSAVHVDDVVDAIRNALTGEMPGGVYNVAGGLWAWPNTVEVMRKMAPTAPLIVKAPENVHGWIGDPMAIVNSNKLWLMLTRPEWRRLEDGCRDALTSLGWGQ